MTSLLSTIIGVFGYILIGFVIKKINIIPDQFSKIYNYVSFNVLLPLALITNFWTITFPELIVHQLILAFFGAGIIIFLIGFFFSKKFLNFKTDDSALFGLGACFGNSVAFGIPLMLILSVIVLAKSSVFQLHPKELSMGITFDLVFVIPTIYFLLIRKSKIPQITTAPIFIAGIVIASFIIPNDYQFYLSGVKHGFCQLLKQPYFSSLFIRFDN